jgi:hypothetical protein
VPQLNTWDPPHAVDLDRVPGAVEWKAGTADFDRTQRASACFWGQRSVRAALEQ